MNMKEVDKILTDAAKELGLMESKRKSRRRKLKESTGDFYGPLFDLLEDYIDNNSTLIFSVLLDYIDPDDYKKIFDYICKKVGADSIEYHDFD